MKYKLLFLGRHGQGWHNVAEAFYGTPAWDDDWSKLNGNGTITWGPDAQLTPLGVEQAKNATAAWKEELLAGIPEPEVLYSSPLSRAAETAKITFDWWFSNKEKGKILEVGRSNSSEAQSFDRCLLGTPRGDGRTHL